MGVLDLDMENEKVLQYQKENQCVYFIYVCFFFFWLQYGIHANSQVVLFFLRELH